MPPQGWMNDPNGLCQFQGVYHVFFQYSPDDARGGDKYWGHYQSTDLLHWEYKGIVLAPDQPFDKDGVYSGSALVDGGQMALYYTGNVKEEGGHDYIHSGRGANTVLVTSPDGEHFSAKECLMTNDDYPSHYTCHIRDPKVWKQGNVYYMVQGGWMNCDKGAVLLFSSPDLRHWKWIKEITTPETFGYMWECPDYFTLSVRKEGQTEQAGILSIAPQGVPSERYRYQNIYQSGYFTVQGELPEEAELGEFNEWDMGFDFYAPQTFQDEQGRRILIGWAGIPDAEYDNEPTIERGWQHALTMPRQLQWRFGKVYQTPVEEFRQLRGESTTVEHGTQIVLQQADPQEQTPWQVYEWEVTEIDSQDFLLEIEQGESGLLLHYGEGIFAMEFYGVDGAKIGRGRTVRQFRLEQLQKVTVYLDTSLAEVYINDGEYVMTSRYYMQNEEVHAKMYCEHAKSQLYRLEV